jgi:hypothetical protein
MKRPQPEGVVMDAVVSILEKMFAQARRGTEKLGPVAPELQHPQMILLDRVCRLPGTGTEQVDFMA